MAMPRAARVLSLGTIIPALTVLAGGPVRTQPAPETAAVANAFTAALQERDALPPAEGSLWRYEGPRNLGKGSHYMGEPPYSGRINEVAIDPRNPHVMLATGATGGVWKTTDGGRQWVSRSDGWPIESATAVAIDPANTNRIFVGTGDYKRLDHVAPFSVGIMVSLDGGETWQCRDDSDAGDCAPGSGAEIRNYTISRIVVDPANPENVLAASGRGSRLPGGRIFRSTDGGMRWAPLTDPPDGNWDDLEACSGGAFWAAATRRRNVDSEETDGNLSGLLYRSDTGESWTSVNVVTATFDLNAGGTSPDLILLACGGTVLGDAVFAAVYGTGGARVFATVNDGQTWTEVTDSPVDTGSGPWAHAAFGLTATRLYLGGVPILGADLPRAGAVRFGTLAFDTSRAGGAAGHRTHDDMQCAVPDPVEADAVFLCTDGGLYHYSPATNIATPLSATLGVTQAYRMDVHPRHGGLIGIGSQDLGDAVSFFGNGASTADLRKPPSWALVTGGDGRSAAFEGSNSSVVFVANTYGEVTRYDGAQDTQILPPGPTSQAPLLFRPTADALDYANTRFRELLNPGTADAATAAWSSVAFPVNQVIQALAACPTNPQIIYAATQRGRVFYSENGGVSWAEAARAGLPQEGIAFVQMPIWTVSPAPGNCYDVLIGFGYEGGLPLGGNPIRTGANTFHAGDRLFRNTDVRAASWSGVHGTGQVLPHAPVFAIARRPAVPQSSWYVAGDVGVFRTDDGGATWTNATEPLGLPNTPVRDLRFSADGNTLYAATFGRGVWSMDISRPAPDVFGVRGTVTYHGEPVSNASVVILGAGRVRKWLHNTLTSGAGDTTAGIDVTESAPISVARASITVEDAASVSLIAPDGAAWPMSTSQIGKVRTFALTSASAAGLVGRLTRGEWKFTVAGAFRQVPDVRSAFVDFEFTEHVSTATGPDGGYTVEFLRAGSHIVSLFDCDCDSIPITVDSHETSVDFALNPVAVATSALASESGINGRFTVSRSGPVENSLTVDYTIAGTAVSGLDYRALTGRVTIPAGSTTTSISVVAVDDALDEDAETVIVSIVAGAGYTRAPQSIATVQIADNDPTPVLSVSSISVLEGGTARFSLSLSAVSGRSVTVDYATAIGTAKPGTTCGAGIDYEAISGSRTIASGSAGTSIPVATCADTVAEGTETFKLTLSNLQNAVFASSGASTVTGNIVEGTSKTGTFTLAPSEATVDVGERILYEFTWVVPGTRSWHELATLDFRVRRDADTLIHLRYDEGTNSFALVRPRTGTARKAVPPGSTETLDTPHAVFYPEHARVIGSGPTGPSVTLMLPFSFKVRAAGAALIDVAASDDLGNADALVRAGKIRVRRRP